ncbi:uroporphyrinogen-III synthase [Flavihumibacter profundi]|uniref:uroporphyrinogen-III synthase n=1 Tax=Flavihumibacter profundi TaxID=2716883 RepID=UPI001CC6DB32|nr:uroporphyrinogen-III synthase [Flavihumibacter profundi]MBZ5858588.1 uroporphyrinogen-III synthase [Flavihumibacter profundi]
MGDTINILSTRPLDDEILQEASRQGIDIRVLSFIDTAPVQTIEVAEEVEQAALMETVVVFTSMNAVDAVTDILFGHVPDWQIYCIGNTTRKLVADYFGEESIAGTADSAGNLADAIIDGSYADEVFFFCGDQRRDELPDKLKKAGILVNEIVVYETVATPHKLTEPFAGVLFYSPSAVDSFFIHNRLPDHALAFAIGNTTANAIRKYAGNKIIIADEPGKEQLVAKAIEILGNKK